MGIGTKAAAKAAGALKGATKALAGYSSIFHHLAGEHAEVSTMMQRIASSSNDSSAREEVFAELRAALLAHAHGEEKEFYPVLARFPELTEQVSQCVEEHKKVEAKLKELHAENKRTKTWLQRFEVLQHAVQAHVEREENQLFPAANDLLTSNRAQQVYDRYERVEKREKERLAP